MQIGDKVRFLNAIGGGIVKGFKNNNIVLVEEDDGFETPVLIRECIVVGEISSTQANKPTPPVKQAEEIAKPKNNPRIEPAEISGKEQLNVYLAFLPIDIKELGKTDFETFFINDSNYFLFLNYMTQQNNAWVSRYTELIEPNTRVFIEEFTKRQLNELEKICIQFIAFKKDKPYRLKNAHSIELRIDALKFFKLHSFRENDFFEDDALIYPVVVDDIPVREMSISASAIQEAMMQKSQSEKPRQPIAEKKNKTSPVLEIDLHINQLLDSTSGMNNSEMLNYQLSKFHETMEENKNKKGQKIVFIHGKGEGVLRNAILTELKSKYKNFPVQDASFKEYGFGATMVTIK